MKQQKYRICCLREREENGTQMASSTLISETVSWKDLKTYVEDLKKTNLRELVSDAGRCQSMMLLFRQRATEETMKKLFKLAEAAQLKSMIEKMFNGEQINSTENRSMLRVALHALREAIINNDGKNVVPDVWKVLDKINDFTEKVAVAHGIMRA